MTAILRDSTVVVAVVRTHPRAIPLAMITMRKSIHGFPLVFYMGMGLDPLGGPNLVQNKDGTLIPTADVTKIK